MSKVTEQTITFSIIVYNFSKFCLCHLFSRYPNIIDSENQSTQYCNTPFARPFSEDEILKNHETSHVIKKILSTIYLIKRLYVIIFSKHADKPTPNCYEDNTHFHIVCGNKSCHSLSICCFTPSTTYILKISISYT